MTSRLNTLRITAGLVTLVGLGFAAYGYATADTRAVTIAVLTAAQAMILVYRTVSLCDPSARRRHERLADRILHPTNLSRTALCLNIATAVWAWQRQIGDVGVLICLVSLQATFVAHYVKRLTPRYHQA